MAIATPQRYREMLLGARDGGYALPSVNITSSSTAHAVLAGLTHAESDGIIGIGLGGARFASGAADNPAVGALALAEFVHAVADEYPIDVALHTDHCPPEMADTFLSPLIARSRDRIERGLGPLFQSHMFDGSRLGLGDNLDRSASLLAELEPLGIVLELEIGLVGGEEDDIDNTNVESSKLYTTPADMVAVVDRLGQVGEARYMVAASFGNVHGVHAAADVHLDTTVLRDGQQAIAETYDDDTRLLLVFHGGSGSSHDDITDSITHGVVKMNVDTDTQYAYTRRVADHLFSNYGRVLAVDGAIADKKAFEQRAWMKLGEHAMADRVAQACADLNSTASALTSSIS